MNFKKTILKNGLTILTVPMKGAPSVTVLVMVSAGSKYETKKINGLSHFLEHMCFKGTEKRPKASMISYELDSIGSQHNAFTSQEFTGYYAKAHPKYLYKILDVVSDLYLNPIFDPKEIEKEKGVIIEEINMYEDMPNRDVHDVFMQVLYGDQPAGWKIVGPIENIKKITKKDFIDYRRKHYVAAGTKIIVAGHFQESRINEKVRKLFSKIPTSSKGSKIRIKEIQSKPQVKIKDKKTDQTHLVLGTRTFGAKDKRNIALEVLNVILGRGMSSRLFHKLREEMGVGYYIHSSLDEYSDHGYLAVSCGVDKNRVEEVVRAILSEMRKLKDEFVPEKELQKAKDYLLGNMYLGLESSDALAEFYAVQEILRGQVITPTEFSEKIQKVTAEEVKKVAEQIMLDEKLNMAIVGYIKNKKSLSKAFHF